MSKHRVLNAVTMIKRLGDLIDDIELGRRNELIFEDKVTVAFFFIICQKYQGGR